MSAPAMSPATRISDLTLGRVRSDYSDPFRHRMDKRLEPERWHFVERDGMWMSFGFEPAEDKDGGSIYKELCLAVHSDGTRKFYELRIPERRSGVVEDFRVEVRDCAFAIKAFGESGFLCRTQDYMGPVGPWLHDASVEATRLVHEVSRDEIFELLSSSRAECAVRVVTTILSAEPERIRSLFLSWVGA